jgi:hypothetical protein
MLNGGHQMNTGGGLLVTVSVRRAQSMLMAAGKSKAAAPVLQ